MAFHCLRQGECLFEQASVALSVQPVRQLEELGELRRSALQRSVPRAAQVKERRHQMPHGFFGQLWPSLGAPKLLAHPRGVRVREVETQDTG